MIWNLSLTFFLTSTTRPLMIKLSVNLVLRIWKLNFLAISDMALKSGFPVAYLAISEMFNQLIKGYSIGPLLLNSDISEMLVVED